MLAEATQRHQANDIATAEVLYREVLKHEPANFDALHMLAVVGYQTDQIAPALELFEQAYALKPKDFSLLVNYGVALKKANRCEEAIVFYDRALALQPRSYEALFNKAQSFLILGRAAEAAEFYRQSITLNDRDPESHTGLARALYLLKQYDAAIASFEAALAVDPTFTLALVSLAQAYLDREWLTTALLLLERAVQLEPRNAFARSHYSFLLLWMGRLKEGWQSYEGRFWYFDDKSLRRPVPPMYWDGEDLTGKTIHIWPEQGVGDEILFASIVPEIIATAGRVYLECEPRLAPVFARSFPQAEIVQGGRLMDSRRPKGTPPVKVDYQTGIASLGKARRPDFGAFPNHSGYLQADPDKAAALRAKYGGGPLVGVSWRSVSTEKKKSSKLLEWAPILQTPGVTFVNLQYGNTQEDIAAVKRELGVEVISDPDVDQLTDMDAFFAQVAGLDLVLTTSNTTAHVAGSIGKPTWLLLSRGHGVHWYWFWNSDKNPWYPTIRGFRQEVVGDWAPVFDDVAAALRSWAPTAS